MSVYAFIFARGGSKGLPRKNIKLLSGKPLINYSIETALQVEEIDNVFVSTDDSEIADVARKAGAIIIDRPAELAQDNSPEWLAWQQGIEWVEKHYGVFDEFVSLPATSPLRNVNDVSHALAERRKKNADFCISVTEANRSPYFNMVKINEDGFVELANKPESGTVFRRQDTPELFDVTTVAYVSTPAFIMNNKGLFDGDIVSVEVPKERAVDIDDIYDFMFAEVLLNGHDSC